jgi:hypothetical protein
MFLINVHAGSNGHDLNDLLITKTYVFFFLEVTFTSGLDAKIMMLGEACRPVNGSWLIRVVDNLAAQALFLLVEDFFDFTKVVRSISRKLAVRERPEFKDPWTQDSRLLHVAIILSLCLTYCPRTKQHLFCESRFSGLVVQHSFCKSGWGLPEASVAS